MSDFTWHDIQRAIDGTRKRLPGSDVSSALRDIGVAVDAFERNAEHRALRGLMDALGEASWYRYNHEPTFKMAVDILVRTIVASVFEQAPLTRTERNERIIALEQINLDIERVAQAALGDLG